MKKTLYIVLTLALVCCKGENRTKETETPSKGEKEPIPNVFKNAEKSTVLVNMEGTEYKVDCNCSYFVEDYFYFKSDKLETTDTNGDGIVINGHQQDDKMVFTLIVNGKTYSAANLSVNKKEFTASGSGKLFLEGGNAPIGYDTTYQVSCK